MDRKCDKNQKLHIRNPLRQSLSRRKSRERKKKQRIIMYTGSDLKIKKNHDFSSTVKPLIRVDFLFFLFGISIDSH